MGKIIKFLLVNALSLLLLDYLMDSFAFDNAAALLFTAVVMGLLNAVVKPILKVLTFPINIATFGLFSFVLNGIVLMLAFHFSNQSIGSVVTAIIAAVLLSIINSVVSRIIK